MVVVKTVLPRPWSPVRELDPALNRRVSADVFSACLGDSVFVVDGDGFQILRFKDLTAVVAADVIDSVPSGQDFRFIVSAGAFHTRTNLF